MYEVLNFSYDEVEKRFIETYQLNRKHITDKQFIKILNFFWQKRKDMNFMGNCYGDCEDIEVATSQEYKKFVLHQLRDWYYYDDYSYKIQDLFKINRRKENV